MKKIYKLYFPILFISVSVTNVVCQSYFSKIINPDYSTSSLVSDIKVSNDTIMIFTDHFCDADNALCTSIRYMDHAGNIFAETLIDSFNMGNREVAHVSSDYIILSGQELFWPGNSLDFLLVSKSLQNAHRKSFTPFPNFTLINKGLLFWSGNYYAYGDIQEYSQSPVKGFIVKLDFKLDSIVDTFIYDFDNAESRVDDLQITPDNNLSFISKGLQSGTLETKYRIYKIDSLGNVLDTFVHQSRFNIDLEGRLQVTSENNLVYLSKSEDYIDVTDIQSIDCQDYSRNWITNLPFDFYSPARIYDIKDLALTKNDEIIGCGIVASEDEEGIYYSTGLIFKINQVGDVEWQRNINLLNPYYSSGNNNKYRNSSLLTILELENGDLLSTGYVLELDSLGNNIGFDLWILKTDSEGCLDKNNCTDFIVSNKKIALDQIKIYPNPSTDYLDIENQKPIDQVLILDLTGRIVYSRYYQTNSLSERIDISNLYCGTYILQLIDSEKELSFSRFIKI